MPRVFWKYGTIKDEHLHNLQDIFPTKLQIVTSDHQLLGMTTSKNVKTPEN